MGTTGNSGFLRRRLREGGLLVAAISLSLLVAEGCLRVLGLHLGRPELALYRELPAGGFGLRKDFEVNVEFNDKTVQIRTNSLGQRWPEPTGADSRPRIALAGDSFLFGLWADSMEAGMAAVLHNELGPDQFVASNYAVPGYGLADVELQLPDILEFGADFLVVVSYNGNDLLDTFLGPERYRVSEAGVLSLDYEVVSERVPATMLGRRFAIRDRVLGTSRLAQLAQSVWLRVRPPQQAGYIETVVTSDSGITSDRFWSRREYPPVATQAREATLQALARIANFCERNDIRLLLVSVPYTEQVYAADGFSASYEVSLPQAFLGRAADSLGVPWLDLQPSFSEHFRRSGEVLHHLSDGHFNNAGHLLAGMTLARFFREESLK